MIAAQYGGLTATTASPPATFEQWTPRPQPAPSSGGAAGADVRLTKNRASGR